MADDGVRAVLDEPVVLAERELEGEVPPERAVTKQPQRAPDRAERRADEEGRGEPHSERGRRGAPGERRQNALCEREGEVGREDRRELEDDECLRDRLLSGRVVRSRWLAGMHHHGET